jgi:hypothetical protein
VCHVTVNYKQYAKVITFILLQSVDICSQLFLCWLILRPCCWTCRFMWSPHLFLHVISTFAHMISTLYASCDPHTCCLMSSPHILLHVISTTGALYYLHTYCLLWSPHLLFQVVSKLTTMISILAVSCGLHTISHVISKPDVPYGDLHTSLLAITTSVAMISTPVALILSLSDL